MIMAEFCQPASINFNAFFFLGTFKLTATKTIDLTTIRKQYDVYICLYKSI